jgi:hypothetical protein
MAGSDIVGRICSSGTVISIIAIILSISHSI